MTDNDYLKANIEYSICSKCKLKDCYPESVSCKLNNPDGKPIRMNWRGVRVEQYNNNNELVATYKNPTEASKATGIPHYCITSVLKGERCKAGGYFWKAIFSEWEG